MKTDAPRSPRLLKQYYNGAKHGDLKMEHSACSPAIAEAVWSLLVE